MQVNFPANPVVNSIQTKLTERRLPMLGTVAVWLALARDKRDVLMLGAFLLFTALATLVWNILS